MTLYVLHFGTFICLPPLHNVKWPNSRVYVEHELTEVGVFFFFLTFNTMPTNNIKLMVKTFQGSKATCDTTPKTGSKSLQRRGSQGLSCYPLPKSICVGGIGTWELLQRTMNKQLNFISKTSNTRRVSNTLTFAVNNCWYSFHLLSCICMEDIGKNWQFLSRLQYFPGTRRKATATFCCYSKSDVSSLKQVTWGHDNTPKKASQIVRHGLLIVWY